MGRGAFTGGHHDGHVSILRTGKMFAAVTASALLMSAIAAPAAAESVRWRTVVGILQAGNLVGNITAADSHGRRLAATRAPICPLVEWSSTCGGWS